MDRRGLGFARRRPAPREVRVTQTRLFVQQRTPIASEELPTSKPPPSSEAPCGPSEELGDGGKPGGTINRGFFPSTDLAEAASAGNTHHGSLCRDPETAPRYLLGRVSTVGETLSSERFSPRVTVPMSRTRAPGRSRATQVSFRTVEHRGHAFLVRGGTQLRFCRISVEVVDPRGHGQRYYFMTCSLRRG
jgi:hypothetical protein